MKMLFSLIFGKYILYIMVVMVIIGAYPIVYTMSSETIQVTVDNRERITTGSGEDISSKYIVYTNGEVFENVDSWLYFKFNSTDYQNALKESHTYNIKVVGWRVPFLSMYRNIVSIDSVE